MRFCSLFLAFVGLTLLPITDLWAQEISKTSSPAGAIRPGDVMTYTTTVRNTGASTWTNVAIADPLPTGLTYVAGSSSITAPVTVSGDYRDGFESLTYSGSVGSLSWTANNWTETNDDNSPIRGRILITGAVGSRTLRMRGGNRSIQRNANLAGAFSATLTFNMRRVSFDNSNDWVRVLVSNGTTETTLVQYSGAANDTAFVTQTFNISAYAAAGFRLRFLTSPGFSAFADSFFVDDVRIQIQRRQTSTVAGNSPPNLGTLVDLRAGEAATFSLRARVTGALPTTALSVTNVASFTTATTPTPRSAQVTNPLVNVDGDGLAIHADCNDNNPTCTSNCADLDRDSVCDSSDPSLTERFATSLPGAPEGFAFCNLDGFGPNEIAVTVRGGYRDGSGWHPAAGTLLAFDNAGTVLWQTQTGEQFGGYPLAFDADGDGTDEIMVCDLGDGRVCHLFDGNGSEIYATAPLSYPAMTLGGPAAANLDGGSGEDVVILTYGGQLWVLDGATGVERWHYDAFAATGEQFFGHPAVADVDADGDLEIVACGTMFGGVYTFDGRTGVLQRSYIPAVAPDGSFHYCWGSGPTLVDLLGGPELETLVSYDGFGSTSPSLCAISSTGVLLWCADQPTYLSYTSPMAVDADGNGSSEIYLQLPNGLLRKFDVNGGLLAETSVGAESWGAPVPININNDASIEILAVHAQGLSIFDGSSLSVRHQHSAALVDYYPWPVHAAAGSRTHLVAGTWTGQEILFFDLETVDAQPWKALGRSSRHSGN